MRRALAILFWLFGACLARAEEITLLMSTQDVSITANYTGARVTVFGAIERDATAISRPAKYDVVVTVSGPSSPLLVRMKERWGLFWVNRNLVRYPDVPGYFAVLSTGQVETVANDTARERLKMGLTYMLPPQADLPDELNPEKLARKALIRLRKKLGLLVEDVHGIQMPRPFLFAANIPVPDAAPTGRYIVTATVLADGVPLKTTNTSFVVRKIGFEAYVAAYARDHGWLYGLAVVAMAVFFGVVGNFIFRRD